VFARAYGFSLGKIEGSQPTSLCVRLGNLQRPDIQRIHVWEKDRFAPGHHGYEPGITAAAVETHELLLKQCPSARSLARYAGDPCRPARPGELILDCILLSPNQWWIGYHRARSIPSCHPGGMMALEMPPEAVSRAWLKMEEALRWSQLPIPGGTYCRDRQCAGRASQALLARGLIVTGIDPAEMAPPC